MITQTEIPENNIDKYQEVVETMDMFSQTAFTGISAILKLSIGAMEGEPNKAQISTIQEALETAHLRAQEAMNDINLTAEAVDCHYRRDTR